MPFAFQPIEQRSFQSLEELHDWNRQSKEISRIPLDGFLIRKAHFFEDRFFGDSSYPLQFNANGFRAFSHFLGISSETVLRLEEEELATRVLNDLLKSGRFLKSQGKIDFVVRNSDATILGLVSSSYQSYPNSQFLADLEQTLSGGSFQDAEARIDGMEFHSGFLVNTQLFVRFLSEKHVGVISGFGGTGDDITRVGLQCRNSMVGESSVVWEYFLHRLACANGAVVPAGRDVQKVVHSGKAETFRERLRQRFQACTKHLSDVSKMIELLGDIPFHPEKLAGTPGGQMALEVIPDARKLIIDRTGHPEIKVQDEVDRKRAREAAFIRQIPDVALGCDAQSVFKSTYRDNASMFDLINVFTEFAKGQEPERRMGIEERAGSLASWIVENRTNLF